MQDMGATIINRKQNRRKYSFWALAGISLFFTLFWTFFSLYLQWNIPGAIFGALLLPISAIIYPFVLIIGKFGTATIVFNFVFVALSFMLLLNAWIFTQEGHSIWHLRPRTTKIVLKRFYGWVWLNWAQLLGYALLIVLSPLYFLMGPLRQLVFTISLKQKMWTRDHPSFFSILIVFFYFQVAIGIPLLVFRFFGTDKLFEGIIGAFVIITFFALQFQKMTPPYFIPTFVDLHNTSLTNGTFRTKVKPATPTWLYICITNLGVSTFQDCVFQVNFPKGFSILDEFDLYEGRAYAKHFTVRATDTDTTIEFLPRDNYMTFAPCTKLIFPIYALTPKDPAEFQIVTSLASQSAWGVHSQPLSVVVADE